MKKLLILFFLLFVTGRCAAQDFITQWNMNKPGSAPGQLSFGVVTSGPCSYTWETVPAGQNGSGTFSGTICTITNLPTTGIINLLIDTTNFRQVRMAYGPDTGRLKQVVQWGKVHWLSMDSAFAGCKNLTHFPIDTPDLALVENMNYMFLDCQGMTGWLNNVNSFAASGGWNTSTVKSMKGTFMRAGTYFPKVSTWNVSNVEDMSFMFCSSSSISWPLNLANWNTGKVTNMESMFEAFNNSIQGIENWDVSSVYSMRRMFRGVFSGYFGTYYGYLGSFASPAQWDVSNVTDMAQMFYLTDMNWPLGNWDVSKVANTDFMFGMTKHFNQPLNTWNVSQVTTMKGMFFGSKKFNQPIGNWDVSNVADMSSMFGIADSFNQPIGNWDVSNVVDMTGMFAYSQGLFERNVFNQPLDNWNVSQVVGMNSMFYRSNFNQNLGSWVFNSSVSAIEWLQDSRMDCNNYTQSLMGWAANPVQPNGVTLNLGNVFYEFLAIPSRNYLLTSKGWNLSGDFYTIHSCLPGAFNTYWSMDSSGVAPGQLSFEAQTSGSCAYTIYYGNQKMQGTFIGPLVTLTGLPTTGHVILSVKGDSLKQVRMGATADRTRLVHVISWGPVQWTSFDSAFAGCINLNVNATDTPRLANVQSMAAMFDSCIYLTGNYYVNNFNSWHTGSVTNMSKLFRNARLFNRSLTKWATSHVTTMQQMFKGASSYNQRLYDWNGSSLEDMGEMFSGASSFNQHPFPYVGMVKYMGELFKDCTAFNHPIGHWNVSQVINMQGMLKGATAFNQPLQQWVFHPSVNTTNFLQNSGMTCNTYDTCLQGWASRNQASGIYLDAQRPYGNDGWPSRDSLKNQKGWVFNDYWQNCPSLVTELESLTEHTGIFLYPNPAITTVFMDIAVPQQTDLSWYICDLQGRRLLQQKASLLLGSNRIAVSVAGLSSGIYSAIFELNGKRFVRRLEVAR